MLISLNKLNNVYTFQTPENVAITLQLASVPRRVLAYLIDAVVMLVLLLVGAAAGFYLLTLNREWALVLGTLYIFLVVNGYHFFCEWLSGGQSIGKLFLDIKVVGQHGQPIGFWEAFGRNLFRLVDVVVMGVGLLPMMISDTERRFGDYLVGTVVVMSKLPQVPSPEETLNTDLAAMLQPDEAAWLKQLLYRRSSLSSRHADALFQPFAHSIQAKYGQPITWEQLVNATPPE